MILFPFLQRLVFFTSGFGPRWGRLHPGVDYAAVTGTVFHSPIRGRIVIPAYQDKGAGLNIWVVGDNGDIWKCFHLSRILVVAGNTVEAGAPIALTGNTGASTGPHAHVEFWPGGIKPVDPLPYLLEAEYAGRYPGFSNTVPFVALPPLTAQEFLLMAKHVKVSDRSTISVIDFAANLPGLDGADGNGPSGPNRLVGGIVRYDYAGTGIYELATTDDERAALHVLDPSTDAELVTEYDNLPLVVQAR